MALDRLSEKLIDFGFTKDEAEVYVFLSSMGPSPARVVSRRFDINRMRAYRTLKSLEEKGLVERIIGRPMRFVANPLQESLSRYIDGFRERLASFGILTHSPPTMDGVRSTGRFSPRCSPWALRPA